MSGACGLQKEARAAGLEGIARPRGSMQVLNQPLLQVQVPWLL
jgi:hypothetical protein